MLKLSKNKASKPILKQPLYPKLNYTISIYVMLVNTLVAICILGFFGIFGVAVYFRIKVIKAYGILVKNRVQFDNSHIFNRQKLEAEIFPKYPEQRKYIEDFVFGIRLSMSIASILITIITICIAIMMFTNY